MTKPPLSAPCPELPGASAIRARLSIDLQAVGANWRALDALSAAGVKTAAVVETNAYGVGPVGRALRDAGARSLFGALAEEGVAPRAAVGPGPGDLSPPRTRPARQSGGFRRIRRRSR